MITDEILMMDLKQTSNISQKYQKGFQNYVKIPNGPKIYKDDQGWSRIIKELLWEIGSANASL